MAVIDSPVFWFSGPPLTNGLAYARLARLVLARDSKQNPQNLGEADYYSRCATDWAPAELESWLTRTDTLEQTGRLNEALEAVDKAINLSSNDPQPWNLKARIQAKSNQPEEAYESFSKAIRMAEAVAGFKDVLASVLRDRSDLLKRQNRLEEAGRDYCRSRGIPVRDPKTPPGLVDLSLYYNSGFSNEAASMSPILGNLVRLGFPTGVSTFAGVSFEVRGGISLSATLQVFVGTTGTRSPGPASVKDIRVKRQCRRLHFLHGAAGSGEDIENDGTLLAS